MQSIPASPSFGRRLAALILAFILTTQTFPAFAGVYYIHSDHLDTPRAVTNAQNQVIWQNPPLSEPFGSGAPDEDPDGDGIPFTLNLRFPGQYFDQETNAHYNTYRDHYFPNLGRYGQSDPIGLYGGINTYAYVNGSPLVYVDPDGLKELTSECCSAFKELIEFERTQSSALGVIWSLDYNSLGKKLTLLNCDFESIGGPVDVDWMLRVAGFGFGYYDDIAKSLYLTGKPLWNKIDQTLRNVHVPLNTNFNGPGHINSPGAANYWLNSGKRLEEMFEPALEDCKCRFGVSW
jgi:RHS repeat-associated protein